MPDDRELEDLAVALEQARISAELSGEYLKAEACLRHLKELHDLEDKRKFDKLLVDQRVERLRMDEEHAAEHSKLRALWDTRLAELERRARLAEEEMAQRHADELRACSDDESQPTVSSPALLELRRREGALVRALEYEQAAKAKAQADALEAAVLQKLQRHRLVKQQHLCTLLQARQRAELSALRARFRAGMDEHLRERETDEHTLSLRCKNASSELDARQRAARYRLNRARRQQTATPRLSSGHSAVTSSRSAGSTPRHADRYSPGARELALSMGGTPSGRRTACGEGSALLSSPKHATGPTVCSSGIPASKSPISTAPPATSPRRALISS